MTHALITVGIIILSVGLMIGIDHLGTGSYISDTTQEVMLTNPPPEQEEEKGDGFVFPGLETRDSRRSYYGAPPVIPHRIGKTDRECQICHTESREIMGHVSPPSPHPEWHNCQQCHVRGSGPEIFKKTVTIETNWKPITEPKLGSRNHIHAPPTMPHKLHMRENCASCHNKSHPNPDTRVEHSERKNCMQCHVPDYQQSASGFSYEQRK